MQPLVTLYEREPAEADGLPPTLAAAYGGGLAVPDAAPNARPYVIANFVATLDGVVAYEEDSQAGGGAISGKNEPDHMTMGLLRARADAVIFGSGSLSIDSGHLRTPAYIYPPFADAFDDMRRRLGRTERFPISVVVSASGQIDFDEPTFHAPGLRALVATTAIGAARLAARDLPVGTEVFVVEGDADGGVAPHALLEVLAREYGVRVALHEGGPRLLGAFLAAGMVDELFLTLAPQIAGRSADQQRLALVEGHAFSPKGAPWSTLLSIKRADEHLLLRYRLPSLPTTHTQ